MPKINQDLIDRLQKSLGIGQAAVYNRIRETGRQHQVPRRDLAALLLAWERGISIQKYATDEQIDLLGRITGGNNGTPHAAVPPAAARPPPSPTFPTRRKR